MKDAYEAAKVRTQAYKGYLIITSLDNQWLFVVKDDCRICTVKTLAEAKAEIDALVL